MWHIGRCVFHFKVQAAFVWLSCRCKKPALLAATDPALKSRLHAAMHRVQNSAIIRINKI